jgi:hypothetical protein
MKRKLLIGFLAAMLSASTIGSALGAQQGPNPQPPKCVPANTPGCS